MNKYLLASLVAFAAVPVKGYEIATHERITGAAIVRSVLAKPGFLERWGLEGGIDGPKKFSSSKGDSLIVRELIARGSSLEDGLLLPIDVARPKNHFFDPTSVSGGGLNAPIPPNVRVTGIPSPSWALEDQGDQTEGGLLVGGQEFSYKDARKYFLEALTASTEEQRNAKWGRTFQAIGHVIHHIQDMAQPQHVRNDIHVPVLTHESHFEAWTNEPGILDTLPMDPTKIGYDVLSEEFRIALDRPRKFWTTRDAHGDNGKGLADYTNRGFVSAGTNFSYLGQGNNGGNYPSPKIELAIVRPPVRIEDLCAEPGAACPGGLQGWMTFIETTVEDKFRPASSAPNPRTSAYSLFTEDLKKKGAPSVFTLNRFTFAEAYKHLMPRAVAFSAGMINYFFRGEIDVERDEVDPNKFRIVNLGSERMEGRFALYYDAKNGNRYPVLVDPSDPNRDPSDGYAWRLSVTPKMNPDDGTNRSAPVAFVAPTVDESPTSPREINEYILVFNGDLGEEKVADFAPDATGAVVANVIKAPYNATLYVAVRRADGTKQTVRVDKGGTRYVLYGEFDPLTGVALQPGAPSYSMKQVEFPVGSSVTGKYRVRAVAGGIYVDGQWPKSYALDGPTGFRLINNAGVSWVAKSSSPAVGSFTIGPPPSASVSLGGTDTFHFERTYQQGTETLTATGQVQLNLGGKTGTRYFVSGDGLRVGEVRENIGDTAKFYDIELSLASSPTAGLRFVHESTGSTSSNLTTPPCVPGGSSPGTITASGGCAGAAGEGPYTVGTSQTTGTGKGLIGYFGGTKGYITRTSTSGFVRAWNVEYAYNTESSCGSTNWYVTHVGQSSDLAQFSNGSMSSSSSSAPAELNKRVTSLFGSAGCPLSYTQEDLSAPLTRSGKSPAVPLTDKVEDSIYVDYGAGGAHYFRGTQVGLGDYVADASPLGEIFFAKPDMSLIIHEPRFGMAPIQLPGDVVRILGAVWL